MTIHAKINSGQDFWLRTEFPHFYAVTDKDICIEVFEREDAEALKAALVAFDKCTLSTE